MDLALGVALHGSQQVVLFIAPLLVIIGWIAGIGKGTGDIMTLDFGGFHAVALIVSVFLITQLIHDGRSDWYVLASFESTMKRADKDERLEGVHCIAGYVMLGVVAWIDG